jgi:hypothetical protein
MNTEHFLRLWQNHVTPVLRHQLECQWLFVLQVPSNFVTSYCKFTGHLFMLSESRWALLIREECFFIVLTCSDFLMMHCVTDLDFTAVCAVVWSVILQWHLQLNVPLRRIPFVVLNTITHLSSLIILHVLISGNLSVLSSKMVIS